MPFFRNRFAVTCAAFIACAVSSCGDQPVPANPGSAQSLRIPSGLENLANELQGKRVCFIHHLNTTMTTTYTGPDGRAVALTGPECARANEDAQAADAQAQQQQIANAQRAAEEAQSRRDAAQAAQNEAAQNEAALGYKHVTLKDLLLDGKVFAANKAKVSVSGFLHAQSRQNERLYDSYNDFMLHQLNPGAFGYVEALNVGLITKDGSRTLREYLLRCVGGCQITILGRVGECTETNAFGRQSEDFCLVAEDMRAP